MKLLVYPCSMEIGGSQLNAIELADRMVGRGHDVVMFGPDGALVPMVHDLGIDYVTAHDSASWPAHRNGAQLRELVRTRGTEVVHGYEWGPALDLAFGLEAFGRAAVVTTVLSMSVPSIIPRHSPMIVGTAAILAAQRTRSGPSHLMEPPIDTDRNTPRDRFAARNRFGLPAGDLLAVVVCRLTTDLDKLAGVLVAVDVVERLVLDGVGVHLLVVGTGDGLGELQRRADAVNLRTGRTVVTLTGALLDPSDAYDAADVVLGMGSSVMKGMAFARPVVVQGERGFWRTLDEGSLPGFRATGWFGTGGGGGAALEDELRRLAANPDLRRSLGDLGRAVVVEHFSLDRAADQLETIYEQARSARAGRGRVLAELGRCAWEVAKFEAVQLTRRWGARSGAGGTG